MVEHYFKEQDAAGDTCIHLNNGDENHDTVTAYEKVSATLLSHLIKSSYRCNFTLHYFINRLRGCDRRFTFIGSVQFWADLKERHSLVHVKTSPRMVSHFM